jgi:hypothetical protein
MSLYRYLAKAIRNAGFDRRATMSDPNSAAASLNAFSPTESNARQLGFLETGHPSRFAEACSTLKVRPASAPQLGYGKRSYGAKVVDESGAEYWLKVFGLTSSDNERWKAEIEADAIGGVRKPELIQQITWKHDDEFWVARLTTLVTGIVESGPLAEAGAKSVTDAWLESLNQSLESLTRQSCSRVHIQTGLFERWLSRHFRRRIAITPSDWVPSHNDLQWSNVSYPDLSILDWEWYGRSPRGYDQGMLIAYSCHDDALTARLEQAFRSSFESDIGNYGKIFAAHTIRNSIQAGWLNPSMRAPIERLIERWETQIR